MMTTANEIEAERIYSKQLKVITKSSNADERFVFFLKAFGRTTGTNFYILHVTGYGFTKNSILR